MTAIARATTPPNLLGIERKMAYAKRKYHSGWIWTGVTRGLAGMKFSGSPKVQGNRREITNNLSNITKKPLKSLKVKYGWNEILSRLLEIPKGLLEPVWWRKRRCTIETPAIIKGITKWKAKKRVRVALSTAKPPHNQFTMLDPIKGIAEKRFVITVAPQKDICPQGRTYPRKAAAITNNRITTPTDQVRVK